MEARPTTISDILPGEKQFIIPVFQRDYAWRSPNWQLLWDDATTVLEANERELKHLIGPIVLLGLAVPYDVAQFVVIDGQQRLVTLTIVLCVIRDLAPEYNREPLANLIESNYLVFTDAKGNRTHKLVPRIRDRD